MTKRKTHTPLPSGDLEGEKGASPPAKPNNKQFGRMARRVADLKDRELKCATKWSRKRGSRSTLAVVGKTFGRITVTKEDGGIVEGLCSCGTPWKGRRYRLLSGVSKSCGCYQREIAGMLNNKHGHTTLPKKRTKLYCAWINMRNRCYRDEPINHRYKEAGIQVCERWMKGDGDKSAFECFAADVGEPPTQAHTLERKNNHSGHYEPGNVEWATRKVQGNNKVNNRWLTYDGQTLTLAQWSDKLGVNYGTLEVRLNRYKWPLERVLSEPVRRHK